MSSAASSTDTKTSSIEVRVLQEPERSVWNEFVGSVPEGDVLQSWEWRGVKSGDWTGLCITVFRNGVIVAGASILRRKLPLVGCFYYAPRGPLMRDWSDIDALHTLLASIHQHAKADRAAFLKIDPAVTIEHPEITEALGQCGFTPPASTDAQGFGGTQPRCVMQLDLAGRKKLDILASFKSQTRRNIKLSTDKHGVEVLSNLSREDLLIFGDLMQITGARDGFRPRSLAYFQNLWDNLYPSGVCRLFLTRYGDQYLSGALCFRINDKFTYVYGASSNEHRNVMPNFAMQWAMIQWALDQGGAWYDFRGVSPRRKQEGEDTSEVEKEDHLQGLNRFKEGFSPRYVEYIGEMDLIYNRTAYWLYTVGRPIAQNIMRRARNKH